MKKLSVLFLITVLFFNCNDEHVDEEEIACDNGTFDGSVILTTQQEVDDFSALCYSKIDGSLIIGIEGGESDVSNLSTLRSLREVTGWLTIFAKEISSLNGLHNITSTGGLSLRFCEKLTDLSGLESLTKLNGGTSTNSGAFGLRVLYNPNLESLLGLNNLHSIHGFVEIVDNSSLESFNGLNNLERIYADSAGNLLFAANPNLKNLDALRNLNEVGGLLRTSMLCMPGGVTRCGNVSLIDFCGLKNLFLNGTYNQDYVLIKDNAYNPTVQDIIDGNCSQ